MKTFLRSSGTDSYAADAARDFLIVVLGILLALWLESWWQDRQDRAEEQQALLGLLHEFQANRAELERVLDSLHNVEGAARRLLALAGKKLSPTEVESAGRDFVGMFEYWSFSPASGSLSSLISSGKLDLLRNAGLRARLAGWSGLVLELKEEEDSIHQAIGIDLEQRMRGTVGPYPELKKAAPDLFHSSIEEPLADLAFLNTLANVVSWCDITVTEAAKVEKVLDDILRLIQVELKE